MDDDTVTNAEDWVDYAVGAMFNVFGILDSVGYGAPGTLLLRFSDWTQLVIECDRPRDTKPIRIGAHVMVRCRRTEDGMTATAMWELGSVPIPLV